MSLRPIQGWRGLEPGERGASVALGAFDGVHRGHQLVIAHAARAAQKLGAPLGVIAFEPHPRRWFKPDAEPFRLMSLAQQERVMRNLGVERLYLLPFDAEMAEQGHEEFVREVLVEGLGVRHVSAGFDVTFGQGRGGNPELLQGYGAQYGFGVSIAPPVTGADGSKCSSSVIRDHLKQGRPHIAAALLGRPFAIEGAVVHGAKLARKLGFPTANIGLEDYLRPAFGIYASRTRLADGREVPGVSYIGKRPTVNGVEERLEAHLFDFDEDLYGQTLETDLVAYIRGDVKFDTLEAMTDQIAFDVASARAILMPAF